LIINQIYSVLYIKADNHLLKCLYKNIGIGNKNKIEKVNKLLSSLYTLNDFRISLRDELRSSMTIYNFHEDKFIFIENYSIQNIMNYVINAEKF